MNNRDIVIEKLKEMSDEMFLEFVLFLHEQFNCALEDIDNAEWRVAFFTKAYESFETGKKFTYERQNTEKRFTFDPNGEDKAGIAHMLEEAKDDLSKAKELTKILATFDNKNN